MAEILVKGVMTEDGVRKIDYNSLANLPVVDGVLSKNSTNAVQNNVVYSSVNALETKIETINSKFTESGAAADAEKLGGKDPSYYATADAVQAAQNTADEKAPIAHASPENTYGMGTSSNYGHVKLSDSTNSASEATAGVAASPKAVKAAYDLANAALPKSGGTMTNSVTFSSGGVILGDITNGASFRLSDAGVPIVSWMGVNNDPHTWTVSTLLAKLLVAPTDIKFDASTGTLDITL